MDKLNDRELEHIFARLKRIAYLMQEDERFTVFRNGTWFDVMKEEEYGYKLHFQRNDLHINKILMEQEAFIWWKARCFEMYKELMDS